jgi:hypothetical protein
VLYLEPDTALAALPPRSRDAVIASTGAFDGLGRPDRARAMLEIHRVLVPDGLLVMSARGHSPARAGRRRSRPERRRVRQLPVHVSRDAQERRLTEMGFEMLECLELEGGETLVCVARAGPEARVDAVAQREATRR